MYIKYDKPITKAERKRQRDIKRLIKHHEYRLAEQKRIRDSLSKEKQNGTD